MTLVIAHRGDPLHYIENTIPALVSAARHGAAAIEIDVRCTADGVPVVHHDATLRRLWGHPGLLAAMTVNAVRRHAPAVPTLRDTLAVMHAHRVPLVLDLRSVTAAAAAYRAVLDEGAADRVWFCGRPTAMLWLRRRDPRATILMSWASPTPPAEWLVRLIRPSYFNPWHQLLDEQEVRAWHTRGTPVSTWTVDDPIRRADLAAWGVDAVITNQIARVADTIASPATADTPIDEQILHH
jgi:glycerophosphoryl diester phosphodiesterase